MHDAINAAADEGQRAFWVVVARAFPDAQSGDFSPEAQRALDEVLRASVELWAEGNVPRYAQAAAIADDLGLARDQVTIAAGDRLILVLAYPNGERCLRAVAALEDPADAALNAGEQVRPGMRLVKVYDLATGWVHNAQFDRGKDGARVQLGPVVGALPGADELPADALGPHARAVLRPGHCVRFVAPVDRRPHFLVQAGETGIVVDVEGSVTILLDELHDGAEDWDNELIIDTVNGDDPTDLDALVVVAGPFPVKQGARVRLRRNISRDHEFVVDARKTGVVTVCEPENVHVRMDEPFDGGEAWDQTIVWSDDDLADVDRDLVVIEASAA